VKLKNSRDDLKIKLLNSSLINTDIGLNHFNHNKTLYLKILHSFTQRYEDLNLQNLKALELERTLHTLKGLTLTLGMEPLTHSINALEKEISEKNLQPFKQLLKKTLKSINTLL
jgi:chemotaxis protein histidine kinase CheA